MTKFEKLFAVVVRGNSMFGLTYPCSAYLNCAGLFYRGFAILFFITVLRNAVENILAVGYTVMIPSRACKGPQCSSLAYCEDL